MYEYFDVFMKFCTSFDVLQFPKCVEHVIVVGCGHDLYLGNVVVKKKY